MAPKAKEKDTTFFDNLITKEPKITVLSDNPVSLADMKSDIFNFRYHLGPVYDIIRHEKTQMPLTIGINGKWGTGKTTAMQWLFDALEKWKQSDESKGKVKTRNVWFYPWKYHNKEDVWKGLIAEVIIKLLKVELDFQNFKKGFELLLSFIGKSSLDIIDLLKLDLEIFEIDGKKITKTLKSIKKNFHESNHPESNYLNHFEETFKRWVNNSLGENQRMVIFIDDLDRCMPDIALQVLEALKLYLKIDKLIFVIGMDRDIVEKAVKAYYANRRIRGIDPKQYLNKMLQVELQLSPLQKEMVIYLDEQLQTVEYEQNLEYKDEQGNKKFYGLFKRLISKYGGRNPREVKRLINGSLTRGAGAERIEKEANNDGLVFEQGVQIFFIQKILAEQWNRTELVGDGGNGDDFFAEWSKIVREHDGKEGFSCTVSKTTIYKYMPENKKEEMDVIPSHNEKLAESMTDTISQFYISILDDPGYSDLLILLSDKELGQLMRIEFSAEIAKITQEVEPAMTAKDDTTIIRNTIADKLKKEPKDLTEEDYDSLFELNLTGKKVSDITLLKQCKNLKQLYLNNTDISDISPLSQLTNMKVLYLSNTKISNIPTLDNMTNLTELWLGNNQISDISSLSHLTNLTTLSLYNNQIGDISHLAGLTNLTKLDLRINQISDISPLSELASLKQLQLSKTKIIDIEPLKNLTNLVLLDLNNTGVNDLTPIKALDKLTSLYASSTQIDNIHATKKFTNLGLLGITNTKVSDLEPIKDLSNLNALFFSNTLVNNLEPVKRLKKLLTLSFKDTNINELEPLKELSNLQVLKIQNTQINNLEPIKGLSNLKELLLEGCEKITVEQIGDLQKALPDCKIPAAAIKAALIGTKYRLFFNPKVPGLSKTKIMRFGENGTILEGQNNNESSWRIRSGFLELLDSDAHVHSRFYYNPDNNRFSHTNDPDTGSIRKHSIRDQYMLLEE